MFILFYLQTDILNTQLWLAIVAFNAFEGDLWFDIWELKFASRFQCHCLFTCETEWLVMEAHDREVWANAAFDVVIFLFFFTQY